MNFFSHVQAKYHKMTGNSTFKIFMKFGAPMFVFCAGGSYLMEEFQRVRMDYRNDKYNKELMDEILKQKGMHKVDLKADYERLKDIDTSNYQNVRGPRPYEDNIEFLNNREMQEKRLAQILGRGAPSPSPAPTTL